MLFLLSFLKKPVNLSHQLQQTLRIFLDGRLGTELLPLPVGVRHLPYLINYFFARVKMLAAPVAARQTKTTVDISNPTHTSDPAKEKVAYAVRALLEMGTDSDCNFMRTA